MRLGDIGLLDFQGPLMCHSLQLQDDGRVTSSNTPAPPRSLSSVGLRYSALGHWALLWPHLTFGVNGVNSVGLIQQSAGVGDVDRCLLLISCQDPELDPSFPQSCDCVWNSFLQPVFDPSGSWNDQRRRGSHLQGGKAAA